MGKNNILIVDDKQVNIQILSRYLYKFDFNIQAAESGFEALEIVKKFVPDVILMDICMPGMNGIECILEMKKVLKENFFVIFITALKDSETKRRAFAAGAASFMNKPVDLKKLKETIEQCTATDAVQEYAAAAAEIYDVTEPEERAIIRPSDTDSQIIHSNKMKNLGQLSSSVAHDINNFLGGILGNVSLIELSTDDSDILNCCVEIKKAVNNTSELTEAMTTYSKKDSVDRKQVNLADSLNDAINLIERDARYFAKVSKDLKDDMVLVDGIYSELTNIFLNILKNAYQAVENNGQISVSLQKKTFRKTKKVYKDLLRPGDYALVIIEDNGKGISPEVLEHIFEPFFTTKEDGTGLGLSSAYKYLRKNQGSLEVSSVEGKGTAVSLYFSIAGKGVSSSHLEFMRSGVNLDLGGMRIVLMDDDVIFCSSLAGFLKKHNARVVSFTDESFVDFLKVNDKLEDYDVLLVDYQSPFFNSVELIESLCQTNDKIRSYIISGSNIDVSDIERCGFFRKPLSFIKLGEKLLEDEANQ